MSVVPVAWLTSSSRLPDSMTWPATPAGAVTVTLREPWLPQTPVRSTLTVPPDETAMTLGWFAPAGPGSPIGPVVPTGPVFPASPLHVARTSVSASAAITVNGRSSTFLTVTSLLKLARSLARDGVSQSVDYMWACLIQAFHRIAQTTPPPAPILAHNGMPPFLAGGGATGVCAGDRVAGGGFTTT